MSTAARPRTRASFSSSSGTSVTGGRVFGISPTSAMPPRAAWTVPVAMSSSPEGPPGSRKCTCMSVAAGRMTASPTSCRGAPVRVLPSERIQPSSEIAISTGCSFPWRYARPARIWAGASGGGASVLFRRRTGEGIDGGHGPAYRTRPSGRRRIFLPGPLPLWGESHGSAEGLDVRPKRREPCGGLPGPFRTDSRCALSPPHHAWSGHRRTGSLCRSAPHRSRDPRRHHRYGRYQGAPGGGVGTLGRGGGGHRRGQCERPRLDGRPDRRPRGRHLVRPSTDPRVPGHRTGPRPRSPEGRMLPPGRRDGGRPVDCPGDSTSEARHSGSFRAGAPRSRGSGSAAETSCSASHPTEFTRTGSR